MRTGTLISPIYSVFHFLFWEINYYGDKVMETVNYTKSFLYLGNNAKLLLCSSME